TRLTCADSPFPGRITKTLSISGLHDLRPLMKTSMNLRLDEAEAAAESPALLQPREGTAITAWVGADERPELLRQTALLAESWTGVKQVVVPNRHHFDVIEELANPHSAMVRELLSA
ncbi:MAG TPA: alpha/beta hydrolase, partial [Magnetospirillaceae bacterium]|nr:alpha/beta hydrolase [Magnetospirillaceae bacterium]